MKLTPRAVPVSLIREKNFGKRVAAATVNTLIIGSDEVPDGNNRRVKRIPAETSEDATDIDVPSVANVIDDEPCCCSTAISAMVSVGELSLPDSF
jgi:hypothetical protein